MPPPSDRTSVHRHPERADHSRETIHRILDEALTCTVAWVDPDGRPRALPTIQARIDDVLYLHGSRAARAWKAAAAGTELCVVATVIDELVLARTSPHHSMNYRSAVVFGRAREVDAAEPGDADWRETLIVAMPIDEASAKVRTGPPVDDPGDLALDVWAGTLPLRTEVGPPTPAPDLRDGIAEPGYLRGYRRP
jgi:uncharacterized protein